MIWQNYHFLKKFLMWTVFKVFIKFAAILLLFHVLVLWPQGMWDPSSLTRDRSYTLCIKKQSLNHWTSREVLMKNDLLLGDVGASIFLRIGSELCL